MYWETSIYINDFNHITTMNEWINESMSQETTQGKMYRPSSIYCSQDCNANWIEFNIGLHVQIRVINMSMKKIAKNMTSGILLEYTEGHTQ